MTGAEEIRSAQRATWARCSPGWDAWDDVIRDQLAPVAEVMIDRLHITDGHADRRPGPHLDIASGSGEPGLTIAERHPSTHVVLTDLSPEMLRIAERQAAERELTNVETVVCSADDLPFPDYAFDTISVRFGYMFFPDLRLATAEFVRVLRESGRVCSAVWISPEANPWTSLIMDAIRQHVDLPAPDLAGPHMYRCAVPGFVSDLYREAGLSDIEEVDVDVMLVTATPREYWDVASEHVSSAVMALARVDEPTRRQIAADVIEQAHAFERDGAVRIPGAERCIVGAR